MQELQEGALDDMPDDQDPIMHVVKTLRDQRPMMVQSKSQFYFLYDVLRERWRERWASLHPDEAARRGVKTASAPINKPVHNNEPAYDDALKPKQQKIST
jgi:protein-tyrosine phosphatase